MAALQTFEGRITVSTADLLFRLKGPCFLSYLGAVPHTESEMPLDASQKRPRDRHVNSFHYTRAGWDTHLHKGLWQHRTGNQACRGPVGWW